MRTEAVVRERRATRFGVSLSGDARRVRERAVNERGNGVSGGRHDGVLLAAVLTSFGGQLTL